MDKITKDGSFDEDSITLGNDQPESIEPISEYEQLVDELHQEAKTIIKQLQRLKNRLPKLKAMYKKVNRKNKKPKKLSGFYNKTLVPSSLVGLLGYEFGAVRDRVKVVSDLTRMIQSKGLYYENNKQVYRADKAIMEALNLSESVNQQTDPRHPEALSIYTIHKLVARCYTE